MDGGGRSRRRIKASEDPGIRKEYPEEVHPAPFGKSERIHALTVTKWLRNNTQQTFQSGFANPRGVLSRRLASGKRHNWFIGI